jgi:hypothetical protein
MKPIVLKVPPERVELIANAIERDIEHNDDYLEIQELTQTLSWLRYRLNKWRARQPPPPAR